MQERSVDKTDQLRGLSLWRVQQFPDSVELRSFAAAARECLSIVELNHDVEWLEAGRAPGHMIVVIAGFKGVSGTTAQVSSRLARNVRAGALMALKRPGEAFDEINALINRKEANDASRLADDPDGRGTRLSLPVGLPTGPTVPTIEHFADPAVLGWSLGEVQIHGCF